MTTPLELHALREMPPLAAAQLLIGASTGELWAMVTLSGAKVRRNADKQELVAGIMAVLHPPAAPSPSQQQYVQTRIV